MSSFILDVLNTQVYCSYLTLTMDPQIRLAGHSRYVSVVGASERAGPVLTVCAGSLLGQVNLKWNVSCRPIHHDRSHWVKCHN